MKNTVLIFTLCTLLFGACSSEEQKVNQSPHGYDVEFHQGPSEKVAATGDIVEFSMEASSGENQLTPSPMVRELQIPENFDELPSGLDALSLMGIGDSLSVTVPMDSLPAQASDDPRIQKSIQYHLKVTDIMDEETYAAKQQERQSERNAKISEVDSIVQHYIEQYKADQIDNLVDLGDGLSFLPLEESDNQQVASGDNIQVHYYGVLLATGDLFDNSFQRGDPISVQVGSGQVIEGWDRGLQATKYGDAGILFIPSDLAYGDQDSGPIPAGSDLVFYVEVQDQ